MPITELEPEKRRWQFSLLSFLIVVNVTAVLAGLTRIIGLHLFAVLLLLAYLNPLLVLVYILIQTFNDWWDERSRRLREREQNPDRIRKRLEG